MGSFVLKKKKRRLNVWEAPGAVFCPDGFAQVTQPSVCLHILFSKFEYFFFLWRYLKELDSLC